MKVTILTVAYNCADTIATAIESVLNQTYKEIEYLVIDGLSKDNTVQIAQSYIPMFEKKGFTMKVISEADKGMYDALNKGVECINTADLKHLLSPCIPHFQKQLVF